MLKAAKAFASFKEKLPGLFLAIQKIVENNNIFLHFILMLVHLIA